MQTDAQKLQAIETSLRRWHTRLTIASNKVAKLEKQRRRLMLSPRSVAKTVAEMTAPPGQLTPRQKAQVETDHLSEAEFTKLAERDDPFAIPPELNRADPLIAEKMTAARKKAEAAARHAMPLADKAAAAYIKRKK
jgi:hypothetical protein